VKKIRKKTTLVRRARIIYRKHMMPMATKKKAKEEWKATVVIPRPGFDGSDE
jgi:hypothetical protein